jgi:hypothetical protein
MTEFSDLFDAVAALYAGRSALSRDAAIELDEGAVDGRKAKEQRPRQTKAVV